MTDKKTYYVSVQAESIMENQGDAAYEFVIVADDREIGELQELFDALEDADQMTAIRAHIPYVQYHDDPENDDYDAQLTAVYRKLYELGTPETKRHIESMGVLGGLN
jgi:hypothetical protein